ncbi:porin family protein [Flavobacterium frigoris]|uniref:Outer membrane protein beta-barrel domain-containing protein n=1 Tax=Flavobacterium frigoris (strain PS1) TaxID=1086011 RepID=H7FP22_FLAFP|nr:porin family protein [Flavobacterium frigoris]EIA09704.1 hypothetical protein HJ01_00920 [Flavobacterium frigoris PS1]
MKQSTTIYSLKKLILISFVLLFCMQAYSQVEESTKEVALIKIDSLYREDQFFFSFTYNTLQQKPTDLAQNKFSTGFSGGFLRDMPVNKDRTIAFATGLGLSYNSYNQNLFISELGQTPVYSIIDAETAYSKNKFSQLLVDVPIEFRWRTSTYESHKFWRIYGGLKISYLLYNKSTFSDASSKIVVLNNKDFNKVLYGLYISAGYNTINVYAHYGLNSLFKSANIEGKSIDMKALNIGVMFYIL